MEDLAWLLLQIAKKIKKESKLAHKVNFKDANSNKLKTVVKVKKYQNNTVCSVLYWSLSLQKQTLGKLGLYLH